MQAITYNNIIQFQFPNFDRKNNFEFEHQDIWGVVNQWFVVPTNQAQLTQVQKYNLEISKKKNLKTHAFASISR